LELLFPLGVPPGIIFDEIPGQWYKAPSHSTVKRWAEKLGYYKLHLPRPKEDSWTIIIDASIQMGDQKCLIILGCPSKQIPVGRPLILKDLEVLAVKITNKLDGEKILTWLREVKNKFGKIDCICSDQGSDVLYGVRRFKDENPQTIHVADTAHRVANFIKRRLIKNDRWSSFKKEITQARRTMQNTTIAGAMPPNLRPKARYMNVDSMINWADGMLYILDHPEEEPSHAKQFNKHLGWLQNYRKEIKRWTMFVSLANKAKELVRKEGMQHNIEDKFMKNIIGIPLDTEGLKFVDDIVEFFHAHSVKLDPDKIYLGSSEIIESLFGKLKFMEGDQTSFGFTSLVLAAVANVGSFDRNMVAEAIRTVRVADIKEWSEAQIGISVQSFRKSLQQSIKKIKKNWIQNTGEIYEVKSWVFSRICNTPGPAPKDIKKLKLLHLRLSLLRLCDWKI